MGDLARELLVLICVVMIFGWLLRTLGALFTGGVGGQRPSLGARRSSGAGVQIFVALVTLSGRLALVVIQGVLKLCGWLVFNVVRPALAAVGRVFSSYTRRIARRSTELMRSRTEPQPTPKPRLQPTVTIERRRRDDDGLEELWERSP